MGPSKQELYDKAVAGIAAQGFERAGEWITTTTGRNLKCRYLTDDGKRCAIGHNLCETNARFYDHQGAGANDVARDMGWEPIPGFYGDLQNAHDASPNPDDMKRNLRSFGQHYDLEVPECLFPDPTTDKPTEPAIMEAA